MKDSIQNYRSFLRERLIQKQKKNPQFSMRSFAKQLGIQPAFLSYVLNGKRDLSEEMTAQFIDRLGLTTDEGKRLELLVRYEKAQSPTQKKRLLEQLNELSPNQSPLRNLSVDHFVMVSEWYHFAILLLVRLESFDWSVSNVAKTLNLTSLEVEQALERMMALELIEWQKGMRPTRTETRLMVESSTSNAALKKYHTQLFEKATQGLEAFTPQERITSTQNIVLSEKQLPAANTLIQECFRKLIDLSATRLPDAEVYHVGIHAFPLTQNKKLKPNSQKVEKKKIGVKSK